MNKKIKELAIQAGAVESHVEWEADFLEKFSGLIIQECIKRIEATTAPLIENMDSAQNYGYGQWWEGYDDRGDDSIEFIKKHFGLWNDE